MNPLSFMDIIIRKGGDSMVIIKTIEDVGQFVKNLGLQTIIESEVSLTIIYRPIFMNGDIQTLLYQTFTGPTVPIILENVRAWIKNEYQWVKKGILLPLNFDYRDDDFDLKKEILTLGFTNVLVNFEYTNFVEIKAEYCYIDNFGKLQYDGVLYINNIGNKFATLLYMINWIKDNDKFKVIEEG